MARDCPNKRMMLINSNGEYESASEGGEQEEEVEPNAPMETKEEEEMPNGEMLMCRSILHMNSKGKEEEEPYSQRSNIFRARCYVEGKSCSMIIDGGSSVNVASTCLVETLGLKTIEHTHPYNLQWLNDKGNLQVTNQVLISLSVGGYQDEVLCDVVPMSATHILLGRPWQYDRQAKHDGVTNEYLISHKGQRHLLEPLTPQQAAIDRVRVQLDMKEYDARKWVEAFEADEPSTPEGYHDWDAMFEDDQEVESSKPSAPIPLPDQQKWNDLRSNLQEEGEYDEVITSSSSSSSSEEESSSSSGEEGLREGEEIKSWRPRYLRAMLPKKRKIDQDEDILQSNQPEAKVSRGVHNKEDELASSEPPGSPTMSQAVHDATPNHASP